MNFVDCGRADDDGAERAARATRRKNFEAAIAQELRSWDLRS